MRLFRVFLLIVFIGLLGTSCSNSSNVVSNSIIQKRKYNKGYFVSLKLQKQKRDKAFAQEKTDLNAKENRTIAEPLIALDKVSIQPLALNYEPILVAQRIAKPTQVNQPQISSYQPLKTNALPRVIQPNDVTSETNSEDKPMSITAVFALVFAIIALFFLCLAFPGVLPFIGLLSLNSGYFILAIPFGLISILLAAISLPKINSKKKRGGQAATAAFIIGLLSFAISMAVLASSAL